MWKNGRTIFQFGQGKRKNEQKYLKKLTANAMKKQ